MASSSSASINVDPVLHNITPERVVFCYREGDSASLEVAQYYQSIRGLPDENLIALPCSADLYISESQFVSDIQTPLHEALISLGQDPTSSGQKEIWVIILGYNVPIAFYDSENVYADPYDSSNLIAIASRLHRLGYDRDNAHPNPVYNRKVFKFFDADDSEQLYITAVITGPSKTAALQLINRAKIIDNLTFVTGKVYIDPYGLKDTVDQLQYQYDILEFVNKESSNLGLELSLTKASRNDTDPTVNFFSRDSFYFGWYTPRYSKDLFLNQNEKRVFLYNADTDSASLINEDFDINGSDPWCNIAINLEPGYACTAGAVCAPSESSYLRPRPFFEALHQGSTIGEAFLFSSPSVDWRIILIGDPMLVVNFPSALPIEQLSSNTLIPNDEAIRQMKETLEESLAYGYRQARLTDDVMDKIVSSTSISEELNLLGQMKIWQDQKNTNAQNNILSRAVDCFLTYILKTNGQTFEEWLSSNEEKTTEYFNDLITAGLAQGSVSSSFIHDEGHWDYTFQYIHPRPTYENVYFELQVSLSEDFFLTVMHLNSMTSISGWKYESELYNYVQLSDSGLPSNFSGRHIKFISPTDNYLRRTELYFVRWRALDSSGNAITDWYLDSKKLLVKR